MTLEKNLLSEICSALTEIVKYLFCGKTTTLLNFCQPPFKVCEIEILLHNCRLTCRAFSEVKYSFNELSNAVHEERSLEQATGTKDGR